MITLSLSRRQAAKKFKQLSQGVGGNACLFFEEVVEIGRVFVAEAPGDLIDAPAGMLQ